MHISKRGIELIKSFEGFRKKPYKAVSSEKYYTIGYGHYGADVQPGMCITEYEAENILLCDLKKYEKYVNDLNREWTQNQFDALVSFTYNCGKGNLLMLTRNRNNDAVGRALTLYVKAGGKTLKGLVNRRKKEQELFFS